MPTIKLLIVDDEVLIAEYLKDILLSLNMEQIKMAHNREQAMSLIDIFKPDIVLLDIKMENDRVGILMAEEISRLYQLPIIFITAYSDKDTMEAALTTKPVAYITKPFKNIDVYAAVSIVLKGYEAKAGNYFVFKDGYTTVRLLNNDIIYIESERNYITIVTNVRKYCIRQTLEWCSENLPAHQFVRIHRCYIINLEKVEKTTARHVYVQGNVFPMARGRRKNLL
jgi:two-component system, LytTR family, response regulator LytT